MSSRRRNFCFLNLLNLALSPFCDDICPRSSNLFVTQRAEDKSVRSSIRQATDGRCEAQGTLRRNPLQRLRVRLLGSIPGCRQNVLRHARSILYFSKDLPCRCGLGNLTQRSGRREVPEKRGFHQVRRTEPSGQVNLLKLCIAGSSIRIAGTRAARFMRRQLCSSRTPKARQLEHGWCNRRLRGPILETKPNSGSMSALYLYHCLDSTKRSLD
jgi:hypothetical protein